MTETTFLGGRLLLMRNAFLGLFLALATLGYGQPFMTKGFADQDFHSKEWKTIERFGRGEREIVAMGHDAFVEWYCADTRAGKDGLVQAERVFCLALNEICAPILLRLPRREQLFMESMLVSFGDMAKSSFVAGIMATNEGPAWSLPIAKSSTAVVEALYYVLHPSLPAPNVPAVDMEALYAQISERVAAKRPENKEAGGRMKFLTEYIEKNFRNRSPREKAIARNFCIKMTQMALLDPKP